MAAVRYTQEKKQEVIDLLSDGMSTTDVAQLTGVSEITVRRIRRAHEQKQQRGYGQGEVHRSLLELAGDKDLSQYIGKDITKMSLREIIAFLRLLGVKGKLTVEHTLKI